MQHGINCGTIDIIPHVLQFLLSSLAEEDAVVDAASDDEWYISLDSEVSDEEDTSDEDLDDDDADDD